MFNYNLLKLVREEANMSQASLIKELNVRQAYMSKVENGGILPSNELIEKIGQLFDYPISFFEQNTLPFISGLIFHKKRNLLTAGLRNQIEASAQLRVMDALKFYKRACLKTNLPDIEGITSPEGVAQMLRKHWGIKQGPINNLVEIFEKNNILIIPFDFKTDKIDAFMIPIENEIPCIALNTNVALSPDLQRMALAHELGHYLLHRESYPGDETEEEANRFAAELLAPSVEIKKLLALNLKLENMYLLKSQWGVSILSLVNRAQELRLIDDMKYKTLMVYMSARGFRKQEPRCGLQHEHPIMLNNLVKDFLADPKNSIGDLYITESRFKERYPELSLTNE